MEQQQLEQLQNQLSPAVVGGVCIISLIVGLVMIVSGWKIFTKAGEPGWAVLVPIYNVIVWLKISGKPIWWLILLIFPLVNLIIGIMVCIGLAERFGKTAGYGIGIALLGFIFLPLLAFSDAQYVGPKG